MSFKLIRELADFEQDDNVSTRDYFVAASNPDGTPGEQTFRMTIKDVVSEYNREVAVEQAEKAAAGDSLLGGTFSEVEVINGVEVMVDATPITAANIDTLVDPGSGLEVVEICYDVTKSEVPCTLNGQPNPAVKYKQKKLSFAKSSASRSITIRVNDNEGIEYNDNKGLFKVNSSGGFDVKFKYLQDAFQYMNAEIVSADMTIYIYIETDLNEPWFYGNGYRTSLSFKRINIYGSDGNELTLKKIHIKHGVGISYVDPSQFTAAELGEINAQWNGMQQFRHGQYRARATTANPNPTDQATLPTGVILQINPCCVFWVNSNIYWRGIHFVIELHGDSIFAAYRQVDSQVWFSQCKFSAKGYTRPDILNGIPTDSTTLVGISQFFDIRDGSKMHIQNTSDGTAFLDHSGIEYKGIDTSGLELDLAQVNYIANIFLIETGSEVKIVEYQSGLHAVNGQPARTMPSRLTLTSEIVACESFFYLVNASAVVANAPIILASDLSASDINISYAVKAEAFNMIRMWGYTNADGTSKEHVIPGNTFNHPNSAENIDYRNTADAKHSGALALEKYQSYYENYTNWTVY